MAIAVRDHFIRFVILLLILAAIIIVAYGQMHHADHGGVTCIRVARCDVNSMNISLSHLSPPPATD
jgi:hypothetical protein